MICTRCADTKSRSTRTPPNLLVMVESYLGACKIEGKTKDTLRSYAETLKTFVDVVAAAGLPSSLTDFDSSHAYRFLARVAETGVSRSTQWRRQRETRAFFSWLTRHDLIPSNPFAKIQNIKVPQKLVRPLTPNEVSQLLAARDRSTLKGARDRPLVLLLLDTGLRASELVNLDLSDVDFDRDRLHIRHGKGMKQRVARLGEKPKRALLHYIEDFRGAGVGPLLRTCRGLRLTRTALRGILARLGADAGVSGVHPHRFRHTFATWCIENEAREIDVQNLLGHSTSAMMRRYTATYNAEQAAVAHARFSPADRLSAVAVSGLEIAPGERQSDASRCPNDQVPTSPRGEGAAPLT